LRDLDSTIRVAADGGVVLWLHGHRHAAYVVDAFSECPFPSVCAGSASQSGRASYLELVFTGRTVKIQRRLFDASSRRFSDSDTFALDLQGP
jgi:hypothetical protein